MAEIFWSDFNGNEIIWADDNGFEIIWADQEEVVFTNGGFPPIGPVTLLKTINSYLYVQYHDDDDLQAFVASYNALAQSYVDFMNSLNLPNYTQDPVSGALLDWVAAGLYGMLRPSLPTGLTTQIGAYNTFAYNTQPINVSRKPGATTYFVTNDDTFRRIMTWNFYKGDGYHFNIPWLKRRVTRFLFGPNGIDPVVDNTYRVSVTFGLDNEVDIQVTKNQRFLQSAGTFNSAPYNTQPYEYFASTDIIFPSIPEAPILKAAIESGALQLPVQYSYVVTI